MLPAEMVSLAGWWNAEAERVRTPELDRLVSGCLINGVHVSSDGGFAIVDAPIAQFICAHPATASGSFVVTTLDLDTDLEEYGWGTRVAPRQATVEAAGPVDAVRRLLIADEAHPWHLMDIRQPRPLTIQLIAVLAAMR